MTSGAGADDDAGTLELGDSVGKLVRGDEDGDEGGMGFGDEVSFVGVEVDMVGALAPNSEPLKPIRSFIFDCDDMLERIDEAVFAKKLGRLLASLDAAFPGSAKMIVRILVEEVSVGKIKKVKKALRSIGKKSDIIAKASAAA
ncbi:hypothetical protein D1007_03716 [Hordeum vulgare]|nr:hypothetical protein D1007_03716 [Hordeum vulgare]